MELAGSRLLIACLQINHYLPITVLLAPLISATVSRNCLQSCHRYWSGLSQSTNTSDKRLLYRDLDDDGIVIGFSRIYSFGSLKAASMVRSLRCRQVGKIDEEPSCVALMSIFANSHHADTPKAEPCD